MGKGAIGNRFRFRSGISWVRASDQLDGTEKTNGFDWSEAMPELKAFGTEL